MSAGQAWRDAVRDAVRETGCGLVPPPAGYGAFREHRLRLGAEQLEGSLACSESIPGRDWARLARVAGQGAMIGAELYYQFCSGQERARVIRACSLLNLLVSCFDQVLDEQQASIPGLLSRITRARLDAALDPGLKAGRQPVFNHAPEGDPGSAFVALVAEEAFRLCRELASSGTSENDWRVFADCVRDAYAAEVATPGLGLDAAIYREEALQTLWRKSALPVAMLGHVVCLCGDRRAAVDPHAVREVMAAAGSLVGQIDDAVDVPVDLDAGHWNGILLELSGLSGRDIRAMGATACIDGLIEQGLPGEIAARIARGLERVDNLSAGVAREPERFIDHCRCWLSGWFITAAYPRAGQVRNDTGQGFSLAGVPPH